MQEDHSQGLRQARSVARLVEAPWYPVVPGESECVFVKTKQENAMQSKDRTPIESIVTCLPVAFVALQRHHSDVSASTAFGLWPRNIASFEHSRHILTH